MGCGSSNCHRQLYAGPPVYFQTGCAQPTYEFITARHCGSDIPLVPVHINRRCGVNGLNI